ncbi:hypothetical protein D9757_012858 [Collybiopsis confluens]|uniref:TPR-like protein n=1 Tax=Collybiopsis confluens TaxID=2823264 RepID=A0A8H5G1J5_9AGAR|nr:hypothetical protein D9757_012858 [Collybiopsis confluens]
MSADLSSSKKSSIPPQMFSKAQNFSISGNPAFNNANTIFNTNSYVWNEVRNEAQELQTQADTPPDYQERMSFCPSATVFFTGRNKILNAMEDKFIHSPMSVEQNQRKIFVLHGLGGAGKTQCALEFIRKLESKFTRSYLIHARSEELIKASYYDIAKENGLLQLTWEAGRSWLQNHKEEWIIVFDNADDPGLQLGQFLPRSTHGNIVITTRNPALSQLTDTSRKLENMEPNDGIDLLLKHAIKLPEIPSENDRQIAVDIAKELYYFPLAIVQAGAYIYQEKCLGSYLDKLKKQKGLLNNGLSQTLDEYIFPVYSTWELSWQKLSEPSRMFLRVCSQYHYEQIPQQLFEKAEKDNLEDADKPFGPTQALIEAGGFLIEAQLKPCNANNFGQIIHQVKSYSLLQLDRQDVYSLHPLVHHWIKGTLGEYQNKVQWQAQGLMARAIWDVACDKDKEFMQMVAVHAIEGKLFENAKYHVKKIGKLFWMKAGNYQEASKLAELLYEEAAQICGADHEEALQHREDLSRIYYELGRYDEVLRLEEYLFYTYRRIRAEHTYTLGIMQNLGTTYQALGRHSDALKLEEPLFSISAKILGVEHPDTLTRMQNLGITYKILGRNDDALKLEEPLVSMTTKNLGAEHPVILTRMENLGITYKSLGRYSDALKLEESLVSTVTKILGTGHPDTITRSQNLGNTYRTLGKYSDALKLEAPLLPICINTLGPEHPSTLGLMQNLGITYRTLGRYNDALQFEEPLVSISTRNLGAEHPDTLTRMENLGITYRALGRYIDALRLEESLVSTFTRILGTEHSDTITKSQNLGNTYRTLGKYGDALKLEEPLLPICIRTLGPEHPSTLGLMQNLGITYRTLGRYNEALQLEEPLVLISTRNLGAEHPDTLTRMENLGITYKTLGRHSDASKLEATLFSIATRISLETEYSDMFKILGRSDEESWVRLQTAEEVRQAFQGLGHKFGL